MSIFVCMCVLGGADGAVWKKRQREEKSKRKESDLVILYLSTLCFVYRVPTLAGGLQLFSKTGISIFRLAVGSVWHLLMHACPSLPLWEGAV